MLVHAKLELRKNAVDVFAYRHGGERFLVAMMALMARRCDLNANTYVIYLETTPLV